MVIITAIASNPLGAQTLQFLILVSVHIDLYALIDGMIMKWI